MFCREQTGDITVLHSGMNLSSLIQTTSTHVVAGTLTARTGPHTGSYSGLYIPGPGKRHGFYHLMMKDGFLVEQFQV